MTVSYPVALGYQDAIPLIIKELTLLVHTVSNVTVTQSSPLQKLVNIELNRDLSHEELIQLGAYIGKIEAKLNV